MKLSASIATLAAALAVAPLSASASSHQDAPLITLDDPANTTDVYAFVTERDGQQYLTTALSVYPFQEPGIGPNSYRFDEEVRYTIHVSTGDDIAAGRSTFAYEFQFETEFANPSTILQTFLGPLQPNGARFPANQNLRQTYSVTKVTSATNERQVIGRGLRVPPNNQGLVTPFYNQGNDGTNPAKGGVASEAALDPYTQLGVREIQDGYVAFAGQRDDAFYADIQSIFDLDFSFTGGDKPFDSQGGFNVHTIVLSIPLDEVEARGGSRRNPTVEQAQFAGVFATTSRARFERRSPDDTALERSGIDGRSGLALQQVGRQGNPLFAEALLPVEDKDRYNRGDVRQDAQYRQSVVNPQLSAVLGVQPLIPQLPDIPGQPEDNDFGLLEAIFVPDMIKIDLTTGPTTLAGQDGFDRLSVFGGDVLASDLVSPLNFGGVVPAGWPNGRRFGDDVIDIAVIALGGAGPLMPEDGSLEALQAALTTQYAGADVDRVPQNDITYNQVFPYAATPLNGRNHEHHGDAVLSGADQGTAQ